MTFLFRREDEYELEDDTESGDDARQPAVDVVAIGLAAMTLFGLLALGSYNRYDPPSSLVWPPAAEVHNACGRVGAELAHALFTMMGLGAYYALASLAVVTGRLLMRKRIDQPVMRSVGWAMSLLGVATLAAMLLPSWSPGPMVGAGGYLGAMGRSWLEANFAAAGSYLFTLAVLLAGLVLATDYYLFRAAAVATAVSGSGLVKVGVLSQAAAERMGRHQSQDDEAEEAEEQDEQYEYEEEEAEEGDDEYEYEVEDEGEGEDEVEDEGEEDLEEEEPSGLTIKTPNGEVLGGKTKAAKAVSETAAVGAAATVAAAASGLKKTIASALAGSKKVVDEAEAAQPREETKPAGAKEKPKSEREQIMDELEKADHDHDVDPDYDLPPIDMLLPGEQANYEHQEKEIRRKAKILEKTFGDFGFNVKVVEVETGPVIAQYEVELEAGLRLSKITGLADDLAIALRAPSVRIVAPIPGKNTVGIEVPNENRQLVRLREVIEETNGRAKKFKIPVYLGKDVAGNSMAVDLAALPHLLIAGRTGTGKSVCLNTIIASILMTRGPDEVRMLMIDPKMVELSGYRKLPHLMHPVVTDMKKAEAILAWAVDKMEERYQLLANAGVRHLTSYNQLSEEELRERIKSSTGEEMTEAEWGQIPKQLPFIVIVADEMADLMMTAGKDVEAHIIRLAQKSRAVGIHLILATQKPTVDVITGLIKSNLPARIAFQVASRTDSRVVLDEMGADKLLGNGDMLFLSPGTSMLLRGQGTFMSDDEITSVVDYVGTDDQQFAAELMSLKTKEQQEEEENAQPGFKKRDDLYEAAVDVVVRERRGSVSLLQRCLGIGYGRAARLIDYMAEDGIVGEYNGSQAREVAITVEEWEAMSGDGDGDGASASSTADPTDEIESASPPVSVAASPAAWEDEAATDSEIAGRATAEEQEDEWEYEEQAADEPEEDEGEEDEGEEDELEEEGEGEEDDEEAELAEDEEWVYEEEEEEEIGSEEADEGDEEEEADGEEEEWEYEEEDESAA